MLTVNSRSTHGQLTVQSRSWKILSVFKCICSYKRSRSAHGSLMVTWRSIHGQGRYLPVFKYICSYQRSRSAHGPFMVSSRSSHGQGRYLAVFKCIYSYKRSRSAHGTLTVSSGPVTVREDICLYLNVSVHTNGHGHITGRSTKGGYLKKIYLTEGAYGYCQIITGQVPALVWSKMKCAWVSLEPSVCISTHIPDREFTVIWVWRYS